MAVQLKTKIALGGIFLFALLILSGAVSFFYFNKITGEAKEIVRNNYETLDYTKEMLKEMDQLNTNDSAVALNNFESNLELQEKNITEPGEKELTVSLRKNFRELRKKESIDSFRSLIRKDISAIMQLNLQAIDKKNNAAQASAEKAKTIISIILTICILVGLTFIFNFPSLVAAPIASLTRGIRAISNKNYGERIHLNRTDEFGELANAFNSMAEKLDEYEHSNLARILFEKQRAETVINSLKDASIGIENKGVVLFANKQALQLLNLREQDIIGLQQEEVKKRNDLFRFLINEQNSIPFKIVVDGKENYFTKEIIELTDEDNKTGSVIVLKNITPFKELDVAKTNFIATISHELKTPLASSDFSLKLLEDERTGSLTDEQKELVQSLKEDNKRLLRILSELLDLSQVESGKIQLNMQTVSPYEIIQKAEQSILNSAKEKNIEIKKEIGENLPVIKADPEKASWVLNNFLTNAIKYTPENGEIIIKAMHDKEHIEIGVKDFGTGIEAGFQSRIFDRYFKVPNTGVKKGTGLGLAISKDFTEAMGGSIGISSDMGKGSYFFFRLLTA
jgi:signal transduction histidine kinase/HAMP domain-containing protein